MKATSIVICLLVLAASTAQGGVSLGASCNSGTMNISMYIFNGEDFGLDAVGIVVVRDLVGLCDEPQQLPGGPYPIPSLYTDDQHLISDPDAEPGLFYEYRAMVVDAAGGTYPAPGNGDPQPFTIESCGEAVASRGFLVLLDPTYMVYGLAGCNNFCWLSVNDGWLFVDFSQIDQAVIDQYLDSNVAVDLYTDHIYVDGMPGGSGFTVTQMVEAPDGVCGPIPVREQSWGAVKRMFR